jgi:hypothetical protein
MKTKTYWCIKTPDGKLIPQGSKTDKAEAIASYTNTMIREGFIEGKKEWQDASYHLRMWIILENHGYKAVECTIRMHKDGDMQWPEAEEINPNKGKIIR